MKLVHRRFLPIASATDVELLTRRAFIAFAEIGSIAERAIGSLRFVVF